MARCWPPQKCPFMAWGVRRNYGTDCVRLRIIQRPGDGKVRGPFLPSSPATAFLRDTGSWWYPEDLHRTKTEADKAVEANKLFVAAETAKEQARVKALLEDSRRRTAEAEAKYYAEAGLTPTGQPLAKSFLQHCATFVQNTRRCLVQTIVKLWG